MGGLAVNYFLLIDGQFLLKSNQLGPFPLVFSVRPDTFLARTVSAVTAVPNSEPARLKNTRNLPLNARLPFRGAGGESGYETRLNPGRNADCFREMRAGNFWLATPTFTCPAH